MGYFNIQKTVINLTKLFLILFVFAALFAIHWCLGFLFMGYISYLNTNKRQFGDDFEVLLLFVAVVVFAVIYSVNSKIAWGFIGLNIIIIILNNMRRGSRISVVQKDKEEEEEQVVMQEVTKEPHQSLFDNFSPRDALLKTSEWTAPEFSLVFIALFVVATYLHKTQFSYTAIGVVGWLTIQIASNIIQEQDGQFDWFWYFFGLLGNLVYYLVLGLFWALLKIYIDIRTEEIDPQLISKFTACAKDASCILSNMPPLIPIIIENMMSWPLSIAYTITSDPLALIGRITYGKMRYLFANIVIFALDDQRESPEFGIVVWFLIVIGYCVIGFGWSHLKLFIDVWQGTLPRYLDNELQSLYQKQQGYWSFIKRVKSFIIMWGMMWPFSMLYTVLRHPFKIVFDYLYELSKKKYHWIITKAMELRTNNKKD